MKTPHLCRFRPQEPGDGVQAVQADDEQVDVDAALDRGGPGSLITAGPGVVIRLCCIWQASQQVSA